ncbi:MAG: molybdopterin-dependent oxidoreductase [Chloroflexales bacterium]|nr:molybdopterin-dependent oxidoreductase [Chloroflexales bacterium]
MPGLGISLGRGGATTFSQDLQHSDAVVIMGSNMAECHPVAFRWPMKAKARGAKLIHIDPRFTRTSAMANIYAPLRAGSDIVFLGALVNYIINSERWNSEPFFKAYVTSYTNAPTLISAEYRGPDDLEGLFSGWDAEAKRYDTKTWAYQTEEAALESGDQTAGTAGQSSESATEGGLPTTTPPQSGQPAPGAGQQQPGGQPTTPSTPGGQQGGTPQPQPGTPSTQPNQPGDDAQSFSARVGKLVGPPPRQDRTMEDPNTVFQVMRRHYARYTPELVEQVCGTPRDVFISVAETLLANSGPDKTSAFCYAVGWTQHTSGVQLIRTATLVQLLLGNIGRPGGGILALRGHATIQGSTDIATLYNIHPGYLNAPNVNRKHDTLGDYIETETTPTAYWANFPKFIVSQLKAWYGDAATPENQFGYDWLPRITGDHSHMPMFVEIDKGNVKGMFAMGQNPAVGGQNAGFQRRALAKLEWLVVRDLFETETASFWKDSPEVRGGELSPADIQTEVFFFPAAAVPEMDGSFTNTQRLVQWHEKAVDPPGDARSDIWWTVHLGLRLKELYKGSTEARDQGLLNLTWDYIDEEENRAAGWQILDEPSATRILKEINGFTWADKKPLASFADLKDDGTTACGAWIYSGIFAPTADNPAGLNKAASRTPDDWVSLGWGFAWPANRRQMYNRASADPAGNPWAKEARLAEQFGGGKFRGYVYWDPGADAGTSAAGEALRGKWVGLDVPDFPATKPPTAQAVPNGVGLDYHDGASPFIMKGDGKGWLFAPSGAVDGPLPAHYEPFESPVENLVYKQQGNPLTKIWEPQERLAAVGSADYPHILSTYRLTEHHLSGSMSRWLPWLAELQPELFAEISPEHAEELGVDNTDKIKITTPRATITAKALVTRRARPYTINGKRIHYVGLPWHWGYKGIAVGDVVNDLSAMVGDPNVSIHEAKVFVCNVSKA